MRILSGIQPSGTLHLGNYFGMMKPALQLQKEGEAATKGIDLVSLPIGARLSIGDAILEITQIGKECHTRCAIFYQAGDCVMPREGIFARVLRGGEVIAGTPVSNL